MSIVDISENILIIFRTKTVFPETLRTLIQLHSFQQHRMTLFFTSSCIIVLIWQSYSGHTKVNPLVPCSVLVRTLTATIKNASSDDLSFKRHYGAIKSQARPLVHNQSTIFIHELHIILPTIRKSAISDANKIKLLELIGVYSNSAMHIPFKHRLCFFEPEFRSIAKRSYVRSYELLSSSQPDVTAFDRLSSWQKVLLMCSRLMTQSVYPFISEISEIHGYIENTVDLPGDAFIFGDAFHSEPLMMPRRKPWHPRFCRFPTISAVYKCKEDTKSLLYFASLYYEALLAEYMYPLNAQQNVNVLTGYGFVEWSLQSVRWIKRRYFRDWSQSKNVQRFHAFDIMYDHGRYRDVLYVPDDSMEDDIATQAILETWRAFNKSNNSKEPTDCFVNHPEVMPEFLDKLLHLCAKQFVHHRRNIFKDLLSLFARLCGDDGLRLVVGFRHPNSTHEFRSEALLYLQSIRLDWIHPQFYAQRKVAMNETLQNTLQLYIAGMAQFPWPPAVQQRRDKQEIDMFVKQKPIPHTCRRILTWNP